MTKEKKSCLCHSDPDQAEGDIKDTVYQTTGIAHIVIPDTSGIALSTSFFLRVTGFFH